MNKKSFIVILLIFIFSGIQPIFTETDSNINQWKEIKLHKGKAFMIYVFELSLLETPIGIENLPPWNPENQDPNYLQKQVDWNKLEKLYHTIIERIDGNEEYAFISHGELSDTNQMILFHNNENIKFFYDGLLFWVEISFDDIQLIDEMDYLLKYSIPNFKPFFPDQYSILESNRNNILNLFGEILGDFIPESPFKNVKVEKQDVTQYFAHWIVICQEHFTLYDESNNIFECGENYSEEDKCIQSMKSLIEQKSHYDFNSEMMIYNDSTFIILGDYHTFNDYNFRFNDMILLLNIKRVLHEFRPFLLDAYYNPPNRYFPLESYKNIGKYDKMSAFISNAKYASIGLEIGYKAEITPFYPENNFLSKELVEITRSLLMEGEDIRNYITMNEHVQTTFAFFFAIKIAISIAIISILYSRSSGRKLKGEMQKTSQNISNRIDVLENELKGEMQNID